MPDTEQQLPRALTQWVATETLGRVISSIRVAAGGRRHGYAIDVEGPDGEPQALYLSAETEEPVQENGTTKLRMEAAVFRRLEAAGVPVPHVLAVHPTEEAMLMQRVTGSARFSALTDEAERESVARDFIACLAAVHRVDPTDPPLPGFPPPARPREHLLRFLDRWEAAYRTGEHGPDPLLEFALLWLRAHAPDTDRPAAIVQGDTGPGNFLFEGGRVTAVLDWELAHPGDPQEDLGWLSMRAAQEPLPDLAARLEEYADLVGTPLDLPAVRYYRVLAEWTVAVIGHTKPRTDLGDSERGNALVYEQLHRRLTVEAIADAEGLSFSAVRLPDLPDTPNAWIYDMALDQLRVSVVPRIQDGLASRRAKGVARTLKVLRELDRRGASAREQELDSLDGLLGGRPGSVAEGRQAVCGELARGSLDDRAVLAYLWTMVGLDNEIFRPAMGRFADRHLDPLPDGDSRGNDVVEGRA